MTSKELESFRRQVATRLREEGELAYRFSKKDLQDAGADAKRTPPFAVIGSRTMDPDVGRSIRMCTSATGYWVFGGRVGGIVGIAWTMTVTTCSSQLLWTLEARPFGWSQDLAT
jgi:hypothetical protein